MSWLNSFFIAILTGLLAAVAGGLVAAGCVEWYPISSRDGWFLFILAIGFFSGIGGFLAGLAGSRFTGTGFLAGLGICAGATLALAGIAALVAFWLADIPPTLNGHFLTLEVEFRLPKGASDPSANTNGEALFEFFTTKPWSHTVRKTKPGILSIAEIRQEEGRWIVPGSAEIITTRRPKGFIISLGPGQALGFQLDFPGHPGPEDRQWTPWLPKGRNGKPWPESEASYRFRILEFIRQPPATK